MLLFTLTVSLMARRGLTALILPFTVMTLALSPMGTLLSLQYFSAYSLMMLGMLAVLLLDGRLSRGANYYYFFLLQGIATCYFDFLTYPLVTLCMPLLLALYLHRDGRGLLALTIGCGAAWCVGYVGFWALKWIVGSLLVQENLIRRALYRVLYQATPEKAGDFSRLDALAANLAAYCRPGYAVLFGGSALLLAMALAPLAWWLMAANHSIVHTFFTHKEFAIAVFAVLLWLRSAEDVPGLAKRE